MLKVLAGASHGLVMTSGLADADQGAPPGATAEVRALDGPAFAAIYEAWFHEVCRWLRARGIPASDHEDVAQEVFLVVRRRLADFDGRNLGGWLYRITARTASDQRRRAWFRRLLARGSEEDLERLAHGGADPALAAERRQAEAVLTGILSRLGDKQREVFVLFEIEGYSGDQIAGLLEIPVATVWTRLHYARKAVAAQIARRLEREA